MDKRDVKDISSGDMPRNNGDPATEQSPLLQSADSQLAMNHDSDLHLEASAPERPLHHVDNMDDRFPPFYHASGRERTIAYFCFLVMGASVLLPWNLLIIVTSYFDYRLAAHDANDGAEAAPSSPFATFFVPLAYTAANLLLIIQATYSQQKKGFDNVEWKLFASIGTMAGMVAVLLLSTLIEIPRSLYYIFIFLITIAGAGSCASLQSSSAALTTLFDDPFFMQGVMSGQGAIGFGISVVQYLSAWSSSDKTGHQEPDNHSTSSQAGADDKIVASTFRFLLVSLMFILIAGVATYTLIRLPCYKHAMQRHQQLEEARLDDGQDEHHPQNGFPHAHIQHHKSSIWQVNRKIRDLGWSIAYIYAVTIGLFPSITSLIRSVNDNGPNESPATNSLLWLYLGFVIFNTSDWIGRALPGFAKLIFTNKHKLIMATVARTVFIPLMLLCNIARSTGSSSPVINSDLAYLTILAIFGISNGYLTSLLMMRAITEKNLHPEEVDVASSIMLIYLTLGLVLGSLLSNVIGWIAL
ncbi:hypothetical protein P389DRAFT_58669 [Cystobasidium minutum MCA 4210]|uniref:uncharacterized protein n=1 Tax=Cystobasidium minutum MCA 4210 TaxID=1397322 RepID=UPI0034CF24E1|eukprot:jgi/Rhomi1/58669/CE58668_108